MHQRLSRPRLICGLALALAVCGAPPVWAARLHVKEVCGVRGGTAGNAWLEDRDGRTVVMLAEQGGDQRLLGQADDELPAGRDGEPGTQVGSRYCLAIAYDAHGRPTKVLKARAAEHRKPQ